MIRWSLYLRHLSSSAYDMIRESGAITLPCQRTLRDCTFYIQPMVGFSSDVDRQLAEAAKLSSCPSRDKCVILLMDEMHIRSDLVYNKHKGNS